MDKILLIISCSKRKIWDKNPNLGKIEARKAYIGTFTKLAIEYAEKFYPNFYVILSAKYGFLFPWEKIENYNVTFNDPKTNPISVEELRKQAKEKGLLNYDKIFVFGGRKYVKIVKDVFKDKEIIEPFRGLKYGERLKKLKRLIQEKALLYN